MADYEVLRPGGHKTLIDGLKGYARRANSVNTEQLVDQSVTDNKLDPDGVLADVAELQEQIVDVSINVDDLGLYQDTETGLVYPTYRGEISENGIPLAGGGGGGGGGSGNNAVLTVANTSGWISTTISAGASCSVSLEWSSLENGLPTGDGSMSVVVGGVAKLTRTVSQGEVTQDISSYVETGTNKVYIRITDLYGNRRSIAFTVKVVELSIRSSFDTSAVYEAGSNIDYTYVPVGAVEKTVHFELDGTELATETVTVSGRQQSKTIPGLSHGNHVLKVWFTATIDAQTVYSNVLSHSIVVAGSSNVPIVSSSFSRTTATEYETLQIPYMVYTPDSLTSQVTLRVNGSILSVLTVDRTEQVWSYQCLDTGSLTLAITCGPTTRTFTLTVSESEIDVHAETEGLALHLTSYGRSNSEAHPEVWQDADNGVSATLTGFNFVSNGWMRDDDGVTVLRVSNDARVSIPYKPFAADFKQTGKTLEFEFSTHDIYDYDATVIECWYGGRGIKLTAQQATLASEQSHISMQYKEDEHVRVSFTVEKVNEDRLLVLYINGIASGCLQYPQDDNFQQSSAVNISIGNSDCATDIYRIRIYDLGLTRHQVLDNWIADTTNANLMLERYQHNRIYDEYGNVVIEQLPDDLPYMIIECPELPKSKGDKKTCNGSYVDPVTPANSFDFTGCQINVQGTSSSVYKVKNFDLQFKNGFEMSDGTHADNYALAANVIPFNRFVLKADVASSEGANNVELVKLYNDADPYTRPEQVLDPRVRKGIYGFPIVMFWYNPTTGETKFYGKMNFNLPKRAAGPYGYSGEMQSWEFENNTSNLMLFKTDYFDETPYYDPDADETKPEWRKDYEARFPGDDCIDYSKLQELQSFVYSTYRAEATGNALPQSVTYDGTTYTTDTAAYRLAKFRAEFGKYAEIDSFIFYYVFTELFLMIDSRAKNLFIGFSGSTTTGNTAIDRKAIAEPYDMDTALGINNEGALVFSYNLEDTDQIGNVNVFNGQESVLWCNLRDAFAPEVATMYKTLRSGGTLSYAPIERRFEEHQDKWPEAVFNEDAWNKYINPLIAPDQGESSTDGYLSMMQGSKKEQRKWWMYNRFRYLDSKWTAGDAANFIELRGNRQNAKNNPETAITITPYTDIYPTIRWAATYDTSARGTHGVPTTLNCPVDSLGDTEIWIYSAAQIASIGDISKLYVSRAEFSQAVNLQSIVIGSNASGYENTHLREFAVGDNKMLRLVDARNCSGLGDTSQTGHSQTTLNLSACSNLEEVYLEGTKIVSVSLPVGGIIETLHLPETIKNLTIRDQSGISDFLFEGADFSGITTLRIENCGDAIPVLDILADMMASQETNQRVRIIGFTALVESTSDVEDFFDALDDMQGLDENGYTVDTAVVAGTISGLGSITGAWLLEMRERYPYVTIGYEHITSTLTYKSWDGSTTITTQTINDGGNGTYSGTPSRTSTEQYSYTFAGWSLYMDSEADPTATQGITYDRTVYAAYTPVVRTYTVTWRNANATTLEVDYNVPYGSTPHYDGATPTQDGQQATGWDPPVGPITGNTTYTATYVPAYTVRWKWTDSNGEVQSAPNTSVLQGDYATYTGATPDYGMQEVEFVGWVPDPTTTRIYGQTTFTASFHDSRSTVIQYVEGTMDSYVNENAATVAQYGLGSRENLVSVETNVTSVPTYGMNENKLLTVVDLTASGIVSLDNYALINDPLLTHLIIRSSSKASYGTGALNYSNIAKNKGAVYVPSNLVSTYKSDPSWGQFCIAPISDYPTYDYSTLSGSWDDITSAIAAGTFDGQVGDTKLLDLGVEGVVYMQLVGIEQDVLASDGTTKVKTSWVSRELLSSTAKMYTTDTSQFGWEGSGARTYLNDTVFPLLPSSLRSSIKEVRKYSGKYSGSIQKDQTTSDKLWIPSSYEVFGTTSYETQGAVYTGWFSNADRRKKSNQATAGSNWWLRSVASSSNFAFANASGLQVSTSAATNNGVVLGFCI